MRLPQLYRNPEIRFTLNLLAPFCSHYFLQSASTHCPPIVIDATNCRPFLQAVPEVPAISWHQNRGRKEEACVTRHRSRRRLIRMTNSTRESLSPMNRIINDSSTDKYWYEFNCRHSVDSWFVTSDTHAAKLLWETLLNIRYPDIFIAPFLIFNSATKMAV